MQPCFEKFYHKTKGISILVLDGLLYDYVTLASQSRHSFPGRKL